MLVAKRPKHETSNIVIYSIKTLKISTTEKSLKRGEEKKKDLSTVFRA